MLNGRVVLVTGGARGIGAAVCRVLAAHGATVAVNYRESATLASAVAQEIRSSGGLADTFCGDITDTVAVQRMVDQVGERFGRVDGIVNNAIAGAQHGAFGSLGWEGYQAMIDVNAKAVYNTVLALRPVFVRQGGGRVVNIVTELWNSAPADWSMYLAGKGAMVGMSRALSAELGPENITVNMVAPGWMVDEKVDVDSGGSRDYASSTPLRRQGSADEIGNACAFFLSDLAGYVTGAYLPVTGGRVRQTGA